MPLRRENMPSHPHPHATAAHARTEPQKVTLPRFQSLPPAEWSGTPERYCLVFFQKGPRNFWNDPDVEKSFATFPTSVENIRIFFVVKFGLFYTISTCNAMTATLL